jgi:hypothetical protein
MKKLFKLIKLVRGLRQAARRGHDSPRAYHPLHRRPSLVERMLRRLIRR